MALDRGHPPRSLCVLAADAEAPPPIGTELRHQGKVVGRVTSAAASPDGGGIRALAYVKHAAAHVGTELDTDGGPTVRVVRVRRLVR